jgi:RecA-family ATPase
MPTLYKAEETKLATNWESKGGELPAPRFFTELVEDDFIMPEVLIDGIVHRGGKILFSAPSKARKTWATINLLLCVQAGRKWWGFDTVKTKALMIDCELFQAAAYNRVKRVAEAAGIDDLSGIAVQSLRGQRLSLERIKKPTIEFCLDNNIGIIGIDPYYRIGAGKAENSNEEMALFLEGIEEIAHATGAAVALTHHFTKGNSSEKSSIDRMSGAGVFARDPDALISMTEAKASTDSEPIFVIEPTVREFKPTPAFAIRWRYPLWTRDDDTSTELKKIGREKVYELKDVVELVDDNPLTASEWQRECKESLGMSQATFYAEYYREAQRSGLVEQNQQRKWVKR